MSAPGGTDLSTWQAILEAEPALAALFPIRCQPRYLYFSDRRLPGWRFCYTTERMDDGKYAAFIYKPVGKGARSGTPTSLKLVRQVRFTKRKAAAARAEKWLDTAVGRAKKRAPS
jgi:hypothetical protein